MPRRNGTAVLLLAVIVSIAGSALAQSAGLPTDPTGGWMGLLSQAPLAAALMWIFQRVMDRDREREASLIQRDREREAATAKRDEVFAARDGRITDALRELAEGQHDMAKAVREQTDMRSHPRLDRAV